MSPLVPVSDPDDDRLAEYVHLRDVNLRKLLEAEHGIFIAEGEKVIRRAVEAGFEPRSFLLADRWLTSLRDVLSRWRDVPVYVVSPALAERVTGFHVHRGALASFVRRPAPDVATVVTGARRIVVLEDIVDHTNVGAIFRCAAALGVDAALVTPSCADPLYRRSIKVSMGAVFRLPWTRIDPWPRDMKVLRAAGYTVAALALTQEAITLDELVAQRHSKLALVFGTEGHGLRPSTVAAADLTVRIPMAGGIDSLNVGSAAAVAFYATCPRP